MNQYDANDPHCGFVQCAVCDNPIQNEKWFARITHGNRTVALCCPLCTTAFESNPRPYIRRIETLEQLEHPVLA